MDKDNESLKDIVKSRLEAIGRLDVEAVLAEAKPMQVRAMADSAQRLFNLLGGQPKDLK